MRNIVGIIKNINGKVVRKDFQSNTEDDLAVGSLIKLNDNIWLRSLDANVEILLHNSSLNLKAGVRVVFDHEFLKKHNSDEFFDLREIEKNILEIKGTSQIQTPNQYNNDSISNLKTFDIPQSLKAKISVFCTSTDKIIFPKIINNISNYICNFGDISINITTDANAEVELMDIDETKVIAKSLTNQNGISVFTIKEPKDKAKIGLTLLIYKDGFANYKYKMYIVVNKTSDYVGFDYEELYNKNLISNDHNYRLEIVRDYKKPNFDNCDIVNLQIDCMHKNSELFDVKNSLYTNDTNPVFKFDINDNAIPKIFLVGFEDYVLDEPKEIDGIINYENNYCIFVSKSSFMVPGKYFIYIRFMNKDKTNILNETFFSLSIKFENSNIPIIKKITSEKIEGVGAGKYSDVVLYSIDNLNSFNQILSTKSDKEGRFSIDLADLKRYIMSNSRIVIRSIDIYGNKSAAAGVQY